MTFFLIEHTHFILYHRQCELLSAMLSEHQHNVLKINKKNSRSPNITMHYHLYYITEINLSTTVYIFVIRNKTMTIHRGPTNNITEPDLFYTLALIFTHNANVSLINSSQAYR